VNESLERFEKLIDGFTAGFRMTFENLTNLLSTLSQRSWAKLRDKTKTAANINPVSAGLTPFNQHWYFSSNDSQRSIAEGKQSNPGESMVNNW